MALTKVPYTDYQTVVTAQNLNDIQDEIISTTGYTTSNTPAAVAAKSSVLANYVLAVGASVKVKFTYSNTAQNPTLNINSTGAKPIVQYGNTPVGSSSPTSWLAGEVISFVYDGTNYAIVGRGGGNVATLAEMQSYLGTSAPARSNESIYSGKSLSILGDSISTYEGYIPSDNAVFYPRGTVQAVSDTWWYKVMQALGMDLNVNNSWSGSRVTTTSGDAAAGCMTRCQNLGVSPDVIIVYMGINDFNSEVALGTYNGKSAIPATTTTFLEAYGIMLDKIITKYPKAEIWVCTLPQEERNDPTGFPEINGNNVALATFNEGIVTLANSFGVRIIHLDKCGIKYQNISIYDQDDLHPSKFGHSLMANYVIGTMDSTIRTRYAIE